MTALRQSADIEQAAIFAYLNNRKRPKGCIQDCG